jgi:outer membrane protein assembly factor BamA
MGAGERLSFPLTWGGTRRAAVELERTFNSGPISRVEASGALFQSENPRFGIDDRRAEVRGRLERQIRRPIRLGVEASRASVEFDPLDERLSTVGIDGAVDTRNDPGFPRTGVLASGGWRALKQSTDEQWIQQARADVRAYQPLAGQWVLALRGRIDRADRPLPPYERLLLGGGSTLRGYRTGSFDGDALATGSVEVRVPLTSPLGVGRMGVTAFFDAGAVWNVGERIGDARFHQGAGGGWFFNGPFINIGADLARNFDTGSHRVHLTFGLVF